VAEPLFGGHWRFGTLIEALIIAVVGNGMVLLNVNPFWVPSS
jgi:predicted ABC-type sugar transport system permease subunit